jgi:hypothetical protein
MKYCNDPIPNSLVYIGLETITKYPTAFQSGISFKGISQKRPFIIFGAPGCVQLLQDQGFRTFDQWWDESYDKEADQETRIDKIIDIVKYLSSLPQSQLTTLCKEMESILHYNYQHFTSTFVANEISRKNNILDQQFINFDE